MNRASINYSIEKPIERHSLFSTNIHRPVFKANRQSLPQSKDYLEHTDHRDAYVTPTFNSILPQQSIVKNLNYSLMNAISPVPSLGKRRKMNDQVFYKQAQTPQGRGFRQGVSYFDSNKRQA